MSAAAPLPLAKHMPQLDGLRGIAILLVIFFHAGLYIETVRVPFIAPIGWAGVDLFFVLSGFLITGILLDSKSQPGYFRHFYARRALRIWPLYGALLLIGFVAAPLILPHLPFGFAMPPGARWPVYALYLQNLFDTVPPGPLLGPTWSLAIEEQFYVVWPAVIFALRRRALIALCAVLIVLSPVWRAIVLSHGQGPLSVYSHTMYRLDGLALGALIAFLLRSRRINRRALRIIAGSVALIAAALWLGRGHFTDFPPASALVYSCTALLFAGLLTLAITASPTSRLYRALTVRWLRYTGKISYCLYLVHQLSFAVAAWFAARLAFGSPIVKGLIAWALALLFVYGIATMSWYGFESQILRLKSHFEYRAASRAPQAEADVLSAAA